MILGISMQQPTSDGPQPLSSTNNPLIGGGTGPGMEPPEKELVIDSSKVVIVEHHHGSGGNAMGGGTAGGQPSYNNDAAAQHFHHLHSAGGRMPPQQVYVNNTSIPGGAGMDVVNATMMHPGSMAGLESQFQSLGLRQEEGTTSSTDPSSDPNGDVDDDDDDDDNEGNDGEDDPIKLFVGQIPKTLSEEDIFPTFDAFGPLKDVAIIRDKHSGLHRGCAFVTYWSPADALNAQETLHNKFTFPGARRPAQVKPAEPTLAPENKLFIGMLSRKAGETEVRELFEQFGEIREIYMIRNSDGSSKCAAFLRFATRESAVQAIESLNNIVAMDGAARPLIVKFADNKHQRQMRQMRNVRRQEIMVALSGPAGYPQYPQMPPTMALPPAPPGAASPYQMPVPQYGSPPYVPAAQHHPHHHPHPYMYAPPYGPAPPYYQAQNRPDLRPPPSSSRPREGPAGANLFIYHLPHDLTDADLATAFNPFGNVLSAKVYVDKYTGESKGFGFVSYDSVIAAEQAIEQMNGFQIGNKRLKVQHKRIHSHGGGPMAAEPTMSGPSPPPPAASQSVPL